MGADSGEQFGYVTSVLEEEGHRYLGAGGGKRRWPVAVAGAAAVVAAAVVALAVARRGSVPPNPAEAVTLAASARWTTPRAIRSASLVPPPSAQTAVSVVKMDVGGCEHDRLGLVPASRCGRIQALEQRFREAIEASGPCPKDLVSSREVELEYRVDFKKGRHDVGVRHPARASAAERALATCVEGLISRAPLTFVPPGARRHTLHAKVVYHPTGG